MAGPRAGVVWVSRRPARLATAVSGPSLIRLDDLKGAVDSKRHGSFGKDSWAYFRDSWKRGRTSAG
jgi:hypothetical protein